MTTAIVGSRGQFHASAALYPREAPVPIVHEAGLWVPGPVWTSAKISSSSELDPRTVQHIATRYTDWATRSK